MAEPDPAVARFWTLQALRLSGVALVVLGAMAVAGTLDLSQIAGMAMMVVGMLDFFILPLLLARHWKGPDE